MVFSACGMFGIWKCLGCEMLGMWYVRDVGYGMFAGMWDVDLQNAYKDKLLFLVPK